MRHHNSLMHDLLKMVPWSKYEASVEKHEADRGVRTLDSKSHRRTLQNALGDRAVLRWVKQTLKIRKFLGTSENAVRSQIAVALIAHLLLSMAHALQSAVPSLLTFTRLLRANLMQFISIHQLAIQARPPTPVSTNQLELAIC
jgi:hypothetical protein